MEDDSKKLRCYGTYKYPDYALPPGTCGTSVITALTALSLIRDNPRLTFEWHDNTPTSPPGSASSDLLCSFHLWLLPWLAMQMLGF